MSDIREGIRDDGTVAGHVVETHYMECIGAANADGYLRVVIDGPGYNIETRVTLETLKQCGYKQTDWCPHCGCGLDGVLAHLPGCSAVKSVARIALGAREHRGISCAGCGVGPLKPDQYKLLPQSKSTYEKAYCLECAARSTAGLAKEP